MSSESDRSFFRVPCEYQLRFRKAGPNELELFRSIAMRPSIGSTTRTEIENAIQSLDSRDGMKTVIEKAVAILINIDQRIERMEENVLSILLDRKDEYIPYEWVSGDMGAGGAMFHWEEGQDIKVGDEVLLDMLLPDMPEHRIVAAAKVVSVNQSSEISTEFLAIHQDDKEFIHRFVMARQREILRERSRNKQKEPSDPS